MLQDKLHHMNHPLIKYVQKLEAHFMFLLATSEKSVGLSLLIYRWKALPEQKINMLKCFKNTLLSSMTRG